MGALSCPRLSIAEGRECHLIVRVCGALVKVSLFVYFRASLPRR